jgi:hypothetical protein
VEEVWGLEFPILSSNIGNHLSHRVLGELAGGGFCVSVSAEEFRDEEWRGGDFEISL